MSYTSIDEHIEKLKGQKSEREAKIKAELKEIDALQSRLDEALSSAEEKRALLTTELLKVHQLVEEIPQ